jgi:hypothetical protein
MLTRLALAANSQEIKNENLNASSFWEGTLNAYLQPSKEGAGDLAEGLMAFVCLS